MKRMLYTLLFFFSFGIFWHCQKRIIGKIHLQGTVIDWFTNSPLQVTVNVNALKKNNLFPLQESAVNVGNFNNGNDGQFNERVESARSDTYFISFTETKPHALMNFPSAFLKQF